MLGEVANLGVGAELPLPFLKGISPAKILINVDLPAPLGPTRAMRSPRSISRSSPVYTFAVGLMDVVQDDETLSATPWLRKIKAEGFAQRTRLFQLVHFLQLLLAADGLGRPSKPRNESDR